MGRIAEQATTRCELSIGKLVRCLGWIGPAAVVAILAGPAGADEKVEMEFAPEAVQKSGPPSDQLAGALQLYERENYYDASVALHEVVSGKTQDGEAHRQRAEFWMGKTLYHLGFYSASLSYFDKVVQKGEGHAFFNPTLKWLASLSQKLAESSGILEKVGQYNQAQLEQPELAKVRSNLFYLLGRFYYSKGDVDSFKKAIRLFGSVPPGSEAYARAKFMEGVTYVRMYRAQPAAQAFKTVLRAARESPDTNEIAEFEQLALIALARVFYSTKQFDLSIKYYEKIPRTSPHWLPSLFESSWAQFMRGNYSKALGNIHTLNAPYFEGQYFPESLVLKAVIYWKNCLYDRSAAALQEFYAKYPGLTKEVAAILKRTDDPGEFYEYVVRVRKGMAGLDPGVRRLVLSVLADKQTESAFGYVDELDRELTEVQSADPRWKATAMAGEVLEQLTVQKSVAQNTAGGLAQRRLKRLAVEINELNKQAIKVEYENIKGKKNVLEATLRNEQVVAAPAGANNIQPDDEHQYWPFNGEYWRDELGYYRFKIVSKCTR